MLVRHILDEDTGRWELGWVGEEVVDGKMTVVRWDRYKDYGGETVSHHLALTVFSDSLFCVCLHISGKLRDP